MSKKRSGLGRGLNALIPETYKEAAFEPESGEKIRGIETKMIKTNPNQPRKRFDEEKIAALALSIERHGVMQPIIVEASGKGFRIVAGERRYRAAMKAELKSIPCIVRELKPDESMELALIENLQREDLNVIEEAAAFRQLMDEFGLTQEKVAEIVGKSRPYIANVLRLLGLEKSIRGMIENGELSGGHGRALLGLPDRVDRDVFAGKIVQSGWSVRETEKRVKAMAAAGEKPKTGAKEGADPEILSYEENLRKRFATKVNIKNGAKNSGKIEISYHGLDEFDRIMKLLNE